MLTQSTDLKTLVFQIFLDAFDNKFDAVFEIIKWKE